MIEDLGRILDARDVNGQILGAAGVRLAEDQVDRPHRHALGVPLLLARLEVIARESAIEENDAERLGDFNADHFCFLSFRSFFQRRKGAASCFLNRKSRRMIGVERMIRKVPTQEAINAL